MNDSHMRHIHGIVFSIPMFFRRTGAMDLEALQAYVERLARNPGVSCLYAMAYNTRYLQLSVDEIKAVNRLVCEIGRAHATAVIIGHPLGMTERELVRYCEDVADFGADAMSVLYPERYFGQEEPVLSYLRAPNHAGLKTIVHEMKLVSGFDGSLMDWPETLIDQALTLPYVVGIKEDSKNDALTERVLSRYRAHTNVIVAGGGKARAHQLAGKTGIDTWLNGSLMLNPRPASRVYQAIVDRDTDTVQRYLETIERPYFEQVVSPLGWHVAHKLALALAGQGELAERLPMPCATREQRKAAEPVINAVLQAMEAF